MRWRTASRRRDRGVAVVEALVALGLATVALAALAATAASCVRHVRLARDRGVALGLAANQLDALRAGPRADGRDELAVAGTTFARAWTVAGGRGDVTRLGVAVVWPEGAVRLETGAFP